MTPSAEAGLVGVGDPGYRAGVVDDLPTSGAPTYGLGRARAAPKADDELMRRARALAGRSLAQLAHQLGLACPPDLKRHKGWVGQLIEDHLGATAASRAEPDFQWLGIELKTLPVDASGRPTQATYVCMVDPLEAHEARWETSTVHHKLARVLWVPVQSDKAIALPDRRVGMPLLWSPTPAEEAAIRDDWEAFRERIQLGELEAITGHHGEVLQIRPKAANKRERRLGVDGAGHLAALPPRGYYLRASFTREMVARHYAVTR